MPGWVSTILLLGVTAEVVAGHIARDDHHGDGVQGGVGHAGAEESLFWPRARLVLRTESRAKVAHSKSRLVVLSCMPELSLIHI